MLMKSVLTVLLYISYIWKITHNLIDNQDLSNNIRYKQSLKNCKLKATTVNYTIIILNDTFHKFKTLLSCSQIK
jgi:hypothetical protein